MEVEAVAVLSRHCADGIKSGSPISTGYLYRDGEGGGALCKRPSKKYLVYKKAG